MDTCQWCDQCEPHSPQALGLFTQTYENTPEAEHDRSYSKWLTLHEPIFVSQHLKYFEMRPLSCLQFLKGVAVSYLISIWDSHCLPPKILIVIVTS